MGRKKGSGTSSTLESKTGIVMFPKSGKGNATPRIGFPLSWIEALGITEVEPNIKKTFQDGKIIIEKEGV